MISTIERDFIVKDGVACFPMKELPNWYGIPEIGFIYHGEWNDPEIEYKGKRINVVIIENTMLSRYREECEEEGKENKDDAGFDAYMKEHADEVYDLIIAMEE